MGWIPAQTRGQTGKLVLQDVSTLGMAETVRAWKGERKPNPVPYGVQRLIDSTRTLTTVGPCGVEGVGW